MEETHLEISPMKPGEETEICKVVLKVFDEFVGPEFSLEGRRNFKIHASPERIQSGIEKGNTLLVARESGKIRGVLEIRNSSHICQLFVDKEFHGKGIAKNLFKEAKRIRRIADPSITEFTVNASTYAIPVYKKLGFSITEEKLTRDGMVFTPMRAPV